MAWQAQLLTLQQLCQQAEPQRLTGAAQPADQIKWVSSANLHLTLRFLGQSSAATAQQLCQSLDEYADKRALPAFVAELTQLEYWPAPKVLCLAGAATDPGLQRLDLRLDQLALQLGFAARQHPLRPHITLARKAQQLPAVPAAPLRFAGTELVLYHSDSTTAGVWYRPLARWPLSLT
jgi:2'-5' RNA ligase